MDIQVTDALVFCAPPLASATALLAMHWFLGALSQPPVVRYSAGTLITVGVPATAMVLVATLGLSYGELFWAALLLANAGVSGLAVGVAYWIDARRPVSLDDVSKARHAEPGS